MRLLSRFIKCVPSSMVEQLTLNQLVPGSSPGGRTSIALQLLTLAARRCLAYSKAPSVLDILFGL